MLYTKLSPAHSMIVRIMNMPEARLHILLGAVMLATTIWALDGAFSSPKRFPPWIVIVFAIGLLEPLIASVKSYGDHSLFLASVSTPSRYYYLLGVASIWVIGRELIGMFPRAGAASAS